jgi:hypothetical protein
MERSLYGRKLTIIIWNVIARFARKRGITMGDYLKMNMESQILKLTTAKNLN